MYLAGHVHLGESLEGVQPSIDDPALGLLLFAKSVPGLRCDQEVGVLVEQSKQVKVKVASRPTRLTRPLSSRAKR